MNLIRGPANDPSVRAARSRSYRRRELLITGAGYQRDQAGEGDERRAALTGRSEQLRAAPSSTEQLPRLC